MPAPRRSVYAVASDFERLPQHFPRIARSTKVISRDSNGLVVDVVAASFGRFFPVVRMTINVELLPEAGYRCSTYNRTFNTTGEEELLLSDAPGGTEINYSYAVKLRHRWLRPVYAWLVRRFGLRFWKRAYLEPLIAHCRDHDKVAQRRWRGTSLTRRPSPSTLGHNNDYEYSPILLRHPHCGGHHLCWLFTGEIKDADREHIRLSESRAIVRQITGGARIHEGLRNDGQRIPQANYR